MVVWFVEEIMCPHLSKYCLFNFKDLAMQYLWCIWISEYKPGVFIIFPAVNHLETKHDIKRHIRQVY